MPRDLFGHGERLEFQPIGLVHKDPSILFNRIEVQNIGIGRDLPALMQSHGGFDEFRITVD